MNGQPDDLELPPPPPLRNWEEREAGMPGHPPLPGLADEPAPGERAFIELVRRWREGFGASSPDAAPTRDVDLLALSALLLAREYGEHFSPIAWEHVQRAITLASQRHPSAIWIDRLPWRLAAAVNRFDRAHSNEIGELVVNLDHHNSAIRVWVMEVAWMVRPWLPRESAFPLLLKNVADTLLGVKIAWGLTAELFDTDEEFHAAVADWTPKTFEDQFAMRAKAFKDMGTLATQAGFWRLEADCRRIIAETAFRLRKP